VAREAEVAVFVARRGRTEILVLHRSVVQGSYWHTVAGGIEAGETPAEAARRELAEETGLQVDLVGEAFFNTYAQPGLADMPVHAYLVDAADDWEPELDWEHDDHRWVPVDTAPGAYHWPETTEALRALLGAP
jgi:lipoyl(octanoyl) transferase